MKRNKNNNIYLVQEGYSTPLVFSTRRAALKYLADYYPHKEKGEPYYWHTRREAEDRSIQDSEFRAWLIVTGFSD